MSTISNHLQPGTMLHAGSYRIVRFIAAGGFGCTYEAEHILLEKRVAIKEFFMQDYCNRDADTNHVTVGTQSMHEMVDKYKRKFIGEAKALSGLRHEGIVSVSDVFEENGTAYFVMDYVKGQSLADLCKNGPLPEKHALYYIRQVCEALAYVHEHNRLHLDLKPANIMVEASGRTVLIDFGASKQYDATSGENTTTLLGYTPGYAPLEQTEGNVQQFLPATDIYALGATLYRLLTGHTPPSPSYRISEEEMQPLPDSISAGTRQAVEQAMMLNKKKRPQTVHEFIALLDAAVKPAPQPNPIPPTPPTPPAPVKHRPSPITINSTNQSSTISYQWWALLVLITEVIFAYFMLCQSRESDLDSDGMLLLTLYIFASLGCLLSLILLVKVISHKAWRIISIIFSTMFLLNTSLLPIWNGSLTGAYFILSLCLSVISSYTILVKKST